MKSVQRRFNIIKHKFPYWSSYVDFADTIKNQGFSKKAIYYWFNRLVEKNDYSLSDKNSILTHLLKLSTMPEEGMCKA